MKGGQASHYPGGILVRKGFVKVNKSKRVPPRTSSKGQGGGFTCIPLGHLHEKHTCPVVHKRASRITENAGDLLPQRGKMYMGNKRRE